MTLAVLVRTVVERIKAINRYNGYAAEQRERQQLKMARLALGKGKALHILCTITKLSSYQYRSIYLLHCSLDLYPVSTSTAQSIHHYIFARVIMAIEMHY